MSALLAALPMQLVCQLIATGSPGIHDANLASSVNPHQSPFHIETPTTLPVGYIAYPDIGVAYKVYNEVVPWTVARKLCIIHGAQLALIDSVKKVEYVTRQRVGRSNSRTHVGIYRSMLEVDEWISVLNGSLVTSIPWAPGEPSNEWACLTMRYDGSGLENYPCRTEGDYVCEIPIPPGYEVEENHTRSSEVITLLESENSTESTTTEVNIQ